MIRILGIRHHGPGSARAVVNTLEEWAPDVVLVEGPPDADAVISWAVKEGMEPPVALLVYAPDNPRKAAFYPFAVFSPEWQAIRYGLERNVPVRFMDLPLMHRFALDQEASQAEENAAEESGTGQSEDDAEPESEIPFTITVESVNPEEVVLAEAEEIIQAAQPESVENLIRRDPIGYLGRLAGYEDGEQWWEQTIEERRDTDQMFDAVMHAMRALREVVPQEEEDYNPLREAWMRRVIRQAQKEGFERIAVICGAWHAPALENMPKAKEDDALLKKLPKIKTAATWIPWTYDRLSFQSGYGAGIRAPGWYHHLWHTPEETGARWLTHVAGLLRGKGMDTSVAHVIESVRLAESLAALRGRPQPGLTELNEATLTVVAFGEESVLALIGEEMIVSNRIGSVPEDAPQVPLQADVERLQKRLRMQAKADEKTYTLDLREDNDRERSRMLHRLRLLEVPWGVQEHVGGKGTFKEQWKLRWRPEMSIRLIEMGAWGNTLAEAASQFAIHAVENEKDLGKLAQRLEAVIPADLPEAATRMAERLQSLSSQTADILQLMHALPPLAKLSRYGDVRQSNLETIGTLINGLVVRISVGLPNACYRLGDDAATEMNGQIANVAEALRLLQDEEYLTMWYAALGKLIDREDIHGLLAGKACRLLNDAHELQSEEVAGMLGRALSAGNPPNYSAAWLEGFLAGGGTLLLLDDALWMTVHRWVAAMPEELFIPLLPLLRRTFSTFSSPERRKIGERAKATGDGVLAAAGTASADGAALGLKEERGEKALGVLRMLLGVGRKM